MDELPGYGDSQTWPEDTSHPNDPRRVMFTETDAWLIVNELSEGAVRDFLVDCVMASKLDFDSVAHEMSRIVRRMQE